MSAVQDAISFSCRVKLWNYDIWMLRGWNKTEYLPNENLKLNAQTSCNTCFPNWCTSQNIYTWKEHILCQWYGMLNCHTCNISGNKVSQISSVLTHSHTHTHTQINTTNTTSNIEDSYCQRSYGVLCSTSCAMIHIDYTHSECNTCLLMNWVCFKL
jgi:hypothetical protein